MRVLVGFMPWIEDDDEESADWGTVEEDDPEWGAEKRRGAGGCPALAHLCARIGRGRHDFGLHLAVGPFGFRPVGDFCEVFSLTVRFD